MLQIRHLTITHLKDFKNMVSDLSLTVNTSDKIAIIGEEGNGKSTLLKLLMNDALVSDYVSYTGEIQKSYNRYAYLPQSLPKNERKLSLNDYFFGDLDVDLDYSKLYRFAQELHFDSERFTSQQTIATLSGGETLKVQLLKILSTNWDILFLDEPSNDLDIDTLIWLENFLQNTPQTVMFVSHDESLLGHTATKIVHLELVKKKQETRTTVRNLDYENYSQQRQATFEKQTKDAKKEREEYQKAMAKHQRVKQSVEHVLRHTHDSTAGRLLAKKMKNILSQEKRFNREATKMTELPTQADAINLQFSTITPLPSTKRVVTLKQMYLKVGERTLAKNINFELLGQEKIGIIGENGAGKSTFIKELRNLLQKKKGITLGYMPQIYPDSLNEVDSPIDFLTSTGEAIEREKILTHLASLQFTRNEVHHPISQLSGGQKAKLLLLKMVLDQANVLLLDEPTRNFSPTSQPQVRKLFTSYTGAFITVSHDRTFLKEVCQKIYHLTETGLEQVRKEQL
ncbi:ATP-binding cassette domain-containing protein [Streptococcus constellatus subsp. pharyngis]|uniref:ABC transporter, ATP-binding protein n=1 Tax=Streptococcus constellatus subsp. pharyngis SK1060 = CCUG 46377 TaxID=1035184 RepID=F9P6I7_STRCV|nr:ATP-binding cassette domain-containing protein [Streptococcus constellatus]AGU72815.1 putative ABC transporter ATPase [Streptococcus constellatus subsp. pharyngis C232]AGU79975.1 putative ABC transporter ATPase [Streptococcus constellatus subsp. pharyngis C1050]EGV09531.1 ABC transporter, ATP-binding protein [Streptococcus constellatus subsp. pharyngis SK1060 = CCUG 46377]QRP82229.1 ABC-F family ATP-binding cassette domain-containing protein [Streptococcus constellatus]GAD44672.1 hypothetic